MVGLQARLHRLEAQAVAVTELSGRGVGLDVVRAMAQEVGGSVRLSSTAGAGTSLHFQLPLALLVVRTLLVEIAGEPYAFPLARLDQIVALDPRAIHGVEGRDTFNLDDRTIGLVAAREVMALPPLERLLRQLPRLNTVPVVILFSREGEPDRLLAAVHDLIGPA